MNNGRVEAGEPIASECLVSVVMATYNSLRTIDRAIDSVFAQTHANWQLVIVDDASDDETPKRVIERQRKLEDRIVFVRGHRNAGPAKARNRGLALSRGEWIAILDADDAWRPDRLKLLVAEALRVGADAACDNLLGFDDHLNEETVPLFAHLPDLVTLIDAVAAEYAGMYNLGYLKPIVRRAFLDAHGIRYEERLRTGEDLLFLLTILVWGAKVTCLDRPGYIYTTPVGSASGRLSKSTNTSPRDTELSRSLMKLRDGNQIKLSDHERRAINERILFLDGIAPLSDFRHARLQGDWLRVLQLVVTSQRVRQRIWQVLTMRSAVRDGP
jgi:succinoglycan biosynthesis protein ExoO